MLLRNIKNAFLKKRAAQPNPEIIVADNLDLQLRELYRYFITPGALCFDIGANIGARTEIFLQLGARVVCVEPQRDCVAILTNKYQHNPAVQILGVGLASRIGTMNLSICKDANTLSTFSERWKTGRFNSYHWDDQYEVPVTTLDELVKKYGMPHFCKIDVEGFEQEVIKGLTSPVRALSFEFTREFLDDAEQCIEHLGSLGNVRFNFVLGDNLSPTLQFALPDWSNGATLLQQLRTVSTEFLWGDIYARFSVEHG